MKAHSRRGNLHLIGVREHRQEDCEDSVLNICANVGLQFDAHVIVRAHRLGRYLVDRNAPKQ